MPAGVVTPVRAVGSEDPGVVDAAAAAPQVLEFFAALDKAVRARRLYQANNPVYQGFRAGLQEAAVRVWDHLTTLSVGVDEHAFRWQGRTITAGEHRESLPFLFYRDGIRFLTFLPGFEDEIDAFLEVLDRARALDQQADDDMVTLLWHAEFANFHYTYVDALAEGLSVPEADPAGYPVRSLDLGGDSGSFADLKLTLTSAAAPAEPFSRDDFEETLYFLEGGEFDELAAMIQQEVVRDIQHDVLTALFDRLEDGEVERRGEILGILRQLLATFLSRGELASASFVLLELNGVLQGDSLPESDRQKVADIFRELGEPTVLAQLLQALENGNIDPHGEELGVFLSHLGPGAMPLLLEAIETTTVPALQARLRVAVQKLAAANRSNLVTMLRAESVEVIRGAARLVADLGVTEAVPQLAILLRDPDVANRRIAVGALASFRSGTALDALQNALQDPDREVRMGGARGLAAARYLPAREALEGVITGRDVREADLSEKIAMFEAFGSVAGPEGVGLLDRFLNGRKLFGRESSDLRACAAMALGRIASPAARKTLERAADDAEPLVRSAVAKALRAEVANA